MGGRLVHIMENIRGSVGVPVGWSVQTYPRPDPSRVDERTQVIAQERMLWRVDGRLAADVGKPYAIEDEPLLIPQPEWEAEQMAAAQPAPEAETPKRRKK